MRRFALSLVLAALVLTPAAAADPLAPTFAKPVKVLSVHDGDGLRGTVDLGYGLSYTPKAGIRAADYDAWEVNKVRQTVVVTDEEVAKGKVARDDLKALFATGQVFLEDAGELDPHGRLIAILWVRDTKGKWIFVAGWMEAHGHLRTARAK